MKIAFILGFAFSALVAPESDPMYLIFPLGIILIIYLDEILEELQVIRKNFK